jgi:dual-specificity kinase
MSTPSTATATHPPQPHYGYSHHHNYQSASTGYRANNSLLNGASRLGGSYQLPRPSSNLTTNSGTTATSSRPPQIHNQPHTNFEDQSPEMSGSQSSSEQASKKRQRSREPDWNKFYKNGLPKEVIVIDDSPPRQISDSVEALQATTGSRNQANRTVAGGSVRHAAKKRKRDDAGPAYDPLYHLQGSHSNTNTPHYNESPSGSTISTDRTTSALHTTAATSLGSQYSTNGNGINGYQAEDVQPGQKRKRVNTRQQIANEAKRREIEMNGDAYSNYRPPPRPPLKAAEVNVKVVQDVSCSSLKVKMILTPTELLYEEPKG